MITAIRWLTCRIVGRREKDLLRRGMRRPKELYSDEEFEQWVTVFAEWNTYSHSNGHKPTEEERNSENGYRKL